MDLHLYVLILNRLLTAIQSLRKTKTNIKLLSEFNQMETKYKTIHENAQKGQKKQMKRLFYIEYAKLVTSMKKHKVINAIIDQMFEAFAADKMETLAVGQRRHDKRRQDLEEKEALERRIYFERDAARHHIERKMRDDSSDSFGCW